MKQRVGLLLMAGIFGLPLAVQAQVANVTLYGRINLDVEFIKGRQADASNPSIYRLSSNSSRVGLRGMERLTTALDAIFQVEFGINADNNVGTPSYRETFVGLQGRWGTFKAGSFFTPYDDLDPIFGNASTYQTSILATSALWANQSGNATMATGAFDNRIGNSIRYDTPELSGFSGALQFATLENSGKGNAWSAGGFYSKGPLRAGIVYEQHNKLRCYAAGGASFSTCGAVGNTFAAKDSGLSAAASWDFRVVRLAAVYERLDYDTPSGNLRRDLWGISGTVPTRNGSFYAFYGRAAEGKGSASDLTPRINAIAHGTDTGAEQWEVSYTYDLSKRTSFYTGYVRIENDSRANYSLDINPYAVAPGASPNGFLVGMIHLF